MKRSKLVKQVGNPVYGDLFWDRETEMHEFLAEIREGANLRMVAMRRVGKTSMMMEAARILADEYYCLVIDVEKCRTAEDAVVALSMATRPYQTLWAKTMSTFKSAIDALGGIFKEMSYDEVTVKLRVAVTGDWEAKGRALLGQLATADRPVVCFIDELPILVNRLLRGYEKEITPERLADTDRFMSWLRDASQANLGQIRFVLAGSIGLEPLLNRAGLSATVNTFTPFDLGPWSSADATGAIWALANQYDMPVEPGAPEAMIELMGIAIPHHVQLFFRHAWQAWRRGEIEGLHLATIESVYHNRVTRSSRGHVELAHLEERLRLQLDDQEYPLAIDLLTETAVTGALTPEASMFLARDHFIDQPDESLVVLRTLLMILEHDGYVQRSGEKRVFASKLIRDWWAGRFSLGYVPVAERD